MLNKNNYLKQHKNIYLCDNKHIYLLKLYEDNLY